mmetsp:Transcript_17404/g.25357  ORF Transcript_17404/g.25357 Transcript_17404/m.25357 type:complete len:113 (+) Transcript_17404:2-340(+)
MLTPTVQLAYGSAGMLAPRGQCSTFDESADGYLRGEGCAAVLLATEEDMNELEGDEDEVVVEDEDAVEVEVVVKEEVIAEIVVEAQDGGHDERGCGGREGSHEETSCPTALR